MRRTALIVMLLTIITKLLGFGKDIVLSYFYGTSNISDAYIISTTIPSVVFTFISVGIVTSYIPVYSRVLKEKNRLVADNFTNNLLNAFLIVCTIIVIISVIFATPIVKIFASGFNDDTLELSVTFMRISIFSIYFSALIYIFSNYLQMENNFVAPALRGIPLNIVLILFIILSAKFNLMYLAVGGVIAMAIQLIFLLPVIYKMGYRYKPVLDIKDEYLRKVFFLSIPIIIGVSVNQINILVDRTIASQITIGGISALSYANRLTLFIEGIFITSIVTVLYPLISKMAVENNIIGLKKIISDAIRIIILLVVPISVGAMVFDKEIIEILFGRGAFDSQAVSLTSHALFYYSIGLVAFGLREVLSRAFYSLQDTKTPMINASIGIVLNIILTIELSKSMGVGGLALATSISAFITTILLFISLRKKIGSYGFQNIIYFFIKIIIASTFMGLISNFSYMFLLDIFSEDFSLLLAIVIGMLVYLILIYIMRIKDIYVLIEVLKKRRK